MKKYTKYFVFSLLLVVAGVFAQILPPAEVNPKFTQEELDQMLAPIALYPDSLLSQILMAATYPLEVVQAARWSNANPKFNGNAAVLAVSSQNWDASVKSLVAFPQVLQTLDQKIEWTQRLGDAFLAQQSQVMDTVQTLRQKAQQAGNLKTTSQINVIQSNDSIEVAAATPNIVYVPYYDPTVIYGSWWWPNYPPVFWSPWPGYGWNGGFAWGIGIGADLFFGSWDWRGHHVYSRDPRHGGDGAPWRHNPDHRHGVPYRDVSLYQQFGRVVGTPATRTEFRGHEPTLDARPGESADRRLTEPISRGNEPATQESIESQSVSRPFAEPRAHAFEHIERGADVSNFSARGHASLSGRSSAPAASRGSSSEHR